MPWREPRVSRTPSPCRSGWWRRSSRRRRVCVPIPAWVVDEFYSRGIYPWLQTLVTAVSNLVPFALLDVSHRGRRWLSLCARSCACCASRAGGVVDALWEGVRRIARASRPCSCIVFLVRGASTTGASPLERRCAAAAGDADDGGRPAGRDRRRERAGDAAAAGPSSDEVAELRATAVEELREPDERRRCSQLEPRAAGDARPAEVLADPDAVLHVGGRQRHDQSVRARVDRPSGPAAVRAAVRARARVGASGRARRRSGGQRGRLARVHEGPAAARLQREPVSDHGSARRAAAPIARECVTAARSGRAVGSRRDRATRLQNAARACSAPRRASTTSISRPIASRTAPPATPRAVADPVAAVQGRADSYAYQLVEDRRSSPVRRSRSLDRDRRPRDDSERAQVARDADPRQHRGACSR